MTDVAERPGVTTKNLHDWIKHYGDNAEQYQSAKQQEDRIRRLKTDSQYKYKFEGYMHMLLTNPHFMYI